MAILKPTQEALEQAADIVRHGGVVVMPTETVYGLACNALDEQAVRRIYEIKGRPSDNPLIVHIADLEQLKSVAEKWPDVVNRLAARFWPGPLTLVLPKRDKVPFVTTGGLDTVAVRIPKHPVALDLIRKAGCPLAAPSANLFMGLSPTSAEAIDPAVQVDVEVILDGGPCEVGLESTVLDLTGEHPRILRPGGVTRAEVQSVIGSPLGQLPPPNVRKSPGLYPRHYAPKAKLHVVEKVPSQEPGLVNGSPNNDRQIRMPNDPRAYAAMLYASLKKLDEFEYEDIFVEQPPTTSDWEAINDRLKKASCPL